MNVLDLFSGIGGFSLGLERAGMRTVAFCEIEPFARRVLAKHWPDVPCYTDVRELTADRLRSDGVPVDVICGGFPCQDISTAGKGAGIEGERSGLWKEYARLIGELRPRYVIVENVAALLGRGLDVVLGDLSTLGYDAEWHCIPASAVGAPHRRDRVWIVAHPEQPGEGWRGISGQRKDKEALGSRAPSQFVGTGADVADTDKSRLEGRLGEILLECSVERTAWSSGSREILHSDSQGPHAAALSEIHRREDGAGARNGEPQRPDWWVFEPDVGRVAHGIPARVDRLRALGNAVVPQIPEIIGRAIMRNAR